MVSVRKRLYNNLRDRCAGRRQTASAVIRRAQRASPEPSDEASIMFRYGLDMTVQEIYRVEAVRVCAVQFSWL